MTLEKVKANIVKAIYRDVKPSLSNTLEFIDYTSFYYDSVCYSANGDIIISMTVFYIYKYQVEISHFLEETEEETFKGSVKYLVVYKDSKNIDVYQIERKL